MIVGNSPVYGGCMPGTSAKVGCVGATFPIRVLNLSPIAPRSVGGFRGCGVQ